MKSIFIRLNILIITLYCNHVIFGMIVSTNTSWKKQWQINNNIKSSFLVFSNDVIINEIYNKFDFNDALTLRLVGKKFAQCDPILSQLHSSYDNKEKQIVPVCAFYDCVSKKEHEKVKWFLKNKLDQSLFFVSSSDKYYILDPYTLAQSNQDSPMMELLNKYKINIYAEIQRIQRNIGHNGTVIRILSSNRATENREEKIRNLLKKGNLEIDMNNNEKDYDTFNATLIEHNINYPLCIAACCGDISAFELLYNNCEDIKRHYSIPLVIWIAIKNRNLLFISNLLRYESCQLYLRNEELMNILCSFMSVNVPMEGFCNYFGYVCNKDFNLSSNIVLTKKHIDAVKNFIKYGIFPPTVPGFIKKNKDVHNGINEIYEAFNELENQEQKKGQKIEQNSSFCSIQ